MKSDDNTSWHYAFMIALPGTIVCTGLAWLLFETNLGNGMPNVEKILVPICIFIAGSWMLFRKRAEELRKFPDK